MIELTKFRPVIRVNLEPGVYTFVKDSADGKSYLCHLLRKLSTADSRVNSYTYSDKSVFSLAKLFENKALELVMLDRYDMYPGEGVAEIAEFSKGGIVLIDSKNYKLPLQITTCFLTMSANEMVIV